MNTAVDVAPAVPSRPAFSLTRPALWLWASLALVVAGPFLPLEKYLTPRSGVGYWLGIIGGSLMLALLIYPMRKRLPRLSVIGSPRMWFRIHMVFGVAGPLCILYHCVYRLGAANSNVAFVSMAVVAVSGLVGRYLYGRIHSGLYGHKTSLAELRSQASDLRGDFGGAARLLPELAAILDGGEKRIARGLPPLPKALSALLLWRWQLGRVHRYVERTLRAAAATSRPVAQHRRTLAAAAIRHADERLTAARRVAEFESCDQLFSLWHVLHLPLFGMLLVAGIVHVIAVNVY